MKKVTFRVLELCDPPKWGSDVEIGGIYHGEIDEQGYRVYYTDKALDVWVFYAGDTCEIIADPLVTANSPIQEKRDYVKKVLHDVRKNGGEKIKQLSDDQLEAVIVAISEHVKKQGAI